ncbi:MAG: FAD-dependent oxidoreductase [Chloroflexi bacterium]|nr:FAD-dependent oxidoreductase [Chloroflexota bacterium]
MRQVVVVGGGFAGCAAALTARQAGMEVVLIEKMDQLSGLGPWTGQLLTWIARQEVLLTGGGGAQILNLLDSLAIHRYYEMGVPGGSIVFDVTRLAEGMRHLLEEAGVKVRLRSRAIDVETRDRRVETIVLEDGSRIEGDAFVDATGQISTIEECEQYGQGCVLCMVQCPIFGSRISITAKAGVADEKRGSPSYMSCSLIAMESFSPDLRKKIEAEESGYFYLPVPQEFQDIDFTGQWPHPERPVTRHLGKVIQIIHIPFAKTYANIPLNYLRRLPGFENAWLVNPLAGGTGQPLRMGAVAPRENSLRVKGFENLFVAGLKTGHIAGFVEVMFTADLAGYNATRVALGKEPIVLSPKTLIGFFIAEIRDGMTPSDWPRDRKIDPKYHEQGLVSTDLNTIKERIKEAGMMGIYQKPLS